jgi:hypothetical protein
VLQADLTPSPSAKKIKATSKTGKKEKAPKVRVRVWPAGTKDDPIQVDESKGKTLALRKSARTDAISKQLRTECLQVNNSLPPNMRLPIPEDYVSDIPLYDGTS